jgi:hypothetical protein
MYCTIVHQPAVLGVQTIQDATRLWRKYPFMVRFIVEKKPAP